MPNSQTTEAPNLKSQNVEMEKSRSKKATSHQSHSAKTELQKCKAEDKVCNLNKKLPKCQRRSANSKIQACYKRQHMKGSNQCSRTLENPREFECGEDKDLRAYSDVSAHYSEGNAEGNASESMLREPDITLCRMLRLNGK